MELVANIIFFVIFLGMCIIISKILLDSNFEKLFKQGRTSGTSKRITGKICKD